MATHDAAPGTPLDPSSVQIKPICGVAVVECGIWADNVVAPEPEPDLGVEVVSELCSTGRHTIHARARTLVAVIEKYG